MAWKLRKDKLQEDALKEETGEPALSPVSDTETPPSPAFSLNDTAVEEQKFTPDVFRTSSKSFGAEELTGQTGEAHGYQVPEEPHFFNDVTEEPHFAGAAPEEPHFSTAAPPPHEGTLTQAAPLEPVFPDDPAPYSPFVPYQPEPTPPAPAFLGRDEVAPGLASQNDEDGIPRVAPFIVDVPPTAEEAVRTGALVVRIGNLSANFTLLKETTTIGRPDSVAQSYPDIEIELDDAVSRRHAEIRHRGGEYYLVDLMSTNGTLLNGQRVAGDQELRLLPGDRIRMGDRTEIVFE